MRLNQTQATNPSFYEMRRESGDSSLVITENMDESFDRDLYKKNYESIRVQEKISESLLISSGDSQKP